MRIPEFVSSALRGHRHVLARGREDRHRLRCFTSKRVPQNDFAGAAPKKLPVYYTGGVFSGPASGFFAPKRVSVP